MVGELNVQIFYQNNNLKTRCEDPDKAKKKYGNETANNLFKTLNYIKSANSLNDIINFPSLHFHELKGDKKGIYSIDLMKRKSKWRLYIKLVDKNNNPIIYNTGNETNISFLRICEVKDHGK